MGCGNSKSKAVDLSSGQRPLERPQAVPNSSNNSSGGNSSGQQNGDAYPKQATKPALSVQPQSRETVPPPQPEPSSKKELSEDEVKKRLERYMEIEKQVMEWEAKNLPKSLQAKKERLEEVKKTQAELENHYQAACSKVAKEKADVDKMQNPSVKAFFKDQKEFEEKMSKEQEEYLEAVSEQEVAKKQVDDIHDQTKALEKEVQEMSKEMNKLLALYDEQDQILDDIFSGHYGSELENQLEMEVDQLLDRKERIGVAKYKWINGRLLLYHACNQLAFAVRRWQMLGQVPGNNIPAKYQLATETRNNLIAAMANITSAKRYLNNIKFPYCETEEMNTLDKACRNIYIDMQTHERHMHAMQCYSITHRRCAALLQWFDNVIHNTIEKDLARAKAELSPKESALRQERLRLMKEKIGGDTSNLKISDKEMHEDFDDDMLEPELMAISQPDKVEGGESGGLTPGDEGQAPAPTPLPLNELAPPPSQEDLFGNIEQLKKQHEQEQAQLEKMEETNKARMEQGLQEKLRRRRSKRRRMETEE
ncbi:uncharacterized protein LOC101858150 isoform X2 [Aplysia californica]|uniref:Uncharacterized protein LOC101858150 isoform X2 n=1 Tax=Aplysia californica TaxID=6500 RepID=A0ABM0K9K6_APLCA|nr:uncharacterized protein LOC101858150 isoform X2 [Aplysia californica]